MEIGGAERQITMPVVEFAQGGWQVRLCALDVRSPLKRSRSL
jgi:hypothetical protein